MPTKPFKNLPTTFRFDSTSKAALHLLAERDGRSMANMLEWLIRKRCEAEGLGWPPKVITANNAAPVDAGEPQKMK